MKVMRKTLTTAVLAGLGTAGMMHSVDAVNLNEDGLGEILITPYYTVQGGGKTLISIVNTTDQVKIVKVRFHEAKNSREVLDFNLFLSPYDVWVASLQQGTGEAANIFVPPAETSCTSARFDLAPQNTNGIDFVNFAYSGSFDDNGGTGLDRTREGYIEWVEMGVIPSPDFMPNPLPAAEQADANILASYVTHGTTNFNCTNIFAQYDAGGIWFNNGLGWGVIEPIGGLFSNWELIDVQEGRAIGGEAAALEHWYDPQGSSVVSVRDRHTDPGFVAPLLDEGQQDEVALLPIYEGRIFDTRPSPATGTPRVAKARFDNEIDAVSSTLMRRYLMNEYTVNAAVGAATDWVIAFPTKSFYVDPLRNPGLTDTYGTLAPFTSSTFPGTGGGGIGRACEEVDARIWDREENEARREDIDISPPPPDDFQFALCWEVNVVSWYSSTSNVLGSTMVNTGLIPLDAFNNGWARFDLGTDPSPPGGAGPWSRVLDADFVVDQVLTRLWGLPVLGYAVFHRENSNVGVGAEYDTVFNHRYQRQIESAVTLPPAN